MKPTFDEPLIVLNTKSGLAAAILATCVVQSSLVERHVLLADDLDAELGGVLLDDLVRGAREHVVGAGQEQRLHALATARKSIAGMICWLVVAPV